MLESPHSRLGECRRAPKRGKRQQMMYKKTLFVALGFCAVTAFAQNENASDNAKGPVHEIYSDKKNAGGQAAASSIGYHGGPVILGTTHVYYIWYGNWAANTATTILTDFASSVGGSPYFNI